ncbi:MAG TPA: hypothetical protein VFP65_30020 [Anaeromyxobacteraceae bacterium]|nr:hypothetical protein [Anaeromyxobacteraceae bacterium]
MRRAAPLALAAALAAGAACDQPRTVPCPGDRVGSFRFHGTLVDGGCPFLAPDGGQAALDFVATVAYGEGDAVALCVDRADAAPLAGTRQGDAVTLQGAQQPATAPPCACALDVVERVDGQVLRGDGGAATGFAGALTNTLTLVDGGSGVSCEPDAGPGVDAGVCGAPCTARWQLTGTP